MESELKYRYITFNIKHLHLEHIHFKFHRLGLRKSLGLNKTRHYFNFSEAHPFNRQISVTANAQACYKYIFGVSASVWHYADSKFQTHLTNPNDLHRRTGKVSV